MSQLVATHPGRAAAEPLSSTGRARLWVGPGRAVYVGPSLRLDAHTGAVACLALGLDAPFTVEVGGREPLSVRSALIPARVRHRIVGEDGRMAFVYLDPAAPGHGGCLDRMTRTLSPARPIATGHRDESALIDIAASGAGEALMPVANGAAHTPPSDPRIANALRTMQRPGGADVPTSALAAAANVSPSRFLRLFVEQTGTGVRCYRRWARMIVAADVLASGADLTRASADAGFATPSHFSAAFRRMFGLTPSRLFGNGMLIHLDGADHPAAPTIR